MLIPGTEAGLVLQSQKAVKTAGIQTEVHAGFTVLQTDNTMETLRLYRDLTRAMQVLGLTASCHLHAALQSCDGTCRCHALECLLTATALPCTDAHGYWHTFPGMALIIGPADLWQLIDLQAT